MLVFRILKISYGTVTVHELDNLTFSYVRKVDEEIDEFYLTGEINISDRKHEIAAHIIAREMNAAVVWQDLCGNKHFVNSDMVLAEKNSSMFDPRDNLLLNTASVC